MAGAHKTSQKFDQLDLECGSLLSLSFGDTRWGGFKEQVVAVYEIEIWKLYVWSEESETVTIGLSITMATLDLADTGP